MATLLRHLLEVEDKGEGEVVVEEHSQEAVM